METQVMEIAPDIYRLSRYLRLAAEVMGGPQAAAYRVSQTAM